MNSLVLLVKTEPKLRLASLRGALCFACFSAFWTTLVFLLKQNFNLGSDAAGLFGLAGAFGAVAAGLMGRLSDRMDPYYLSTGTLLLIFVSFVVFIFSGHSIAGLIAGVIVLDMGVQATHISNQSIIFSLSAEARNRINTIYMVSYFIGGAAGTFIASMLWTSYRWTGRMLFGYGFFGCCHCHSFKHPPDYAKTAGCCIVMTTVYTTRYRLLYNSGQQPDLKPV